MNIIKLALTGFFLVFSSLVSAAVSPTVGCVDAYSGGTSAPSFLTTTSFFARTLSPTFCGSTTYPVGTCVQKVQTASCSGSLRDLYTTVAKSYTCPSGSTASGSGAATTCTCNAGYIEINGTCQPPCPSGETRDTGGVCQCNAPTVRNTTSGVCENPPPSCPTGKHLYNGQCVDDCKVGNYKVLQRKTHTCTDPAGMPKNDISSCTRVPVSLTDNTCEDSCQYDRVYGDVPECMYFPNTNTTDAYCYLGYKGNGLSCTEIFVSGTGSPSPVSSTPQKISDAQSGVPSGSTAQEAASGGGGVNSTKSPTNTGGAGTTKTKTNNPGGGGDDPPPPPPPPPVEVTVSVAAGCDGCATEATQVYVAKALTDSNGLPPTGPNTSIVDDATMINGIEGHLAGNNKIQSFFHFSVPSHSSVCPTLSLSIPYLRQAPFVLDSHCTIIQPHISTLQSIASAAWVLLAVLIILGA